MPEKRTRRRAKRKKEPLTWEEVRRRNSVERIKHEKQPYDLIDELPQLVEIPYEEIDENEILRLQWWGLYHDKPKIGDFMMRVKIPGGILRADQLRIIGEISRKFGKNFGEITTRQDIQLHHIRLPDVPEIFDTFETAGLTTAGACGDILRNITSCPVAGLQPEETFDTAPIVQELADYFYGNREFSDLPRKHKWTISACPYHCNAPEIHDVALIGTVQDDARGFAAFAGGGLSTVPRISQSLGVFLVQHEVREFLEAVFGIWSPDLNYRRRRTKARFKFMVDDLGPDGVRERLEEHIGRELTPLKQEPVPIDRTDHMGVHSQKQAGHYYIGFPVFPGLISGDQMVRVAEVADQYGEDIRFTREQNFIISGISEDDIDPVVEAIDSIGFSLTQNPARGHSIGCTGNPFCNFAVGDTKPRLVKLLDHLENRFGDQIADIRFHLDGCPHACGQHFVGDIGFQGTLKGIKGKKIQAYDIFLGGGLGKNAAIAKPPVVRRVATDELDGYVERLIEFYLSETSPEETFQEFCAARGKDQLLPVMEGTVLEND